MRVTVIADRVLAEFRERTCIGRPPRHRNSNDVLPSGDMLDFHWRDFARVSTIDVDVSTVGETGDHKFSGIICKRGTSECQQQQLQQNDQQRFSKSLHYLPSFRGLNSGTENLVHRAATEHADSCTSWNAGCSRVFSALYSVTRARRIET